MLIPRYNSMFFVVADFFNNEALRLSVRAFFTLSAELISSGEF